MCEKIDLNSLRLRYNAEFEDWQDFVTAVDEFQKATKIKLTISTSKKLGSSERSKRRRMNDGVIIVTDEEQTKEKFEYKYLKLTCKHYGGYRSTSRGIRPNQKTVKLMCPTYLYGAYDHFKDRFCIKQMVVNCNHELKDEEVLLPSILKTPDEITPTNSNGQKKYVRKRNRCVLKVPLESPNSGTLIVSLKSRVKCNHDSSSNSNCEAYSLTSYDLSSIISQFATKTKDEQNELILQWVEVTPLRKEDSGEEDAVRVQFRLPTIDDSLIKVCSKSFLSILSLNMSRVDGVISANYTERFSLSVQDQNSFKGNEEVETSIATILTSLSREEPQPQVLYIDHADLPSAEDTIEDTFVESTAIVTDDTSQQNTITINIGTELIRKINENSPLFLGDIPWSRQENDPWANNPDLTGVYYKVDNMRDIVLSSLSCRSTNFTLKVYNQPLKTENYTILRNLQKQYCMKQLTSTKPLLDRLNSLKLCRGLTEARVKDILEKHPQTAAQLQFCFYSNSYRSKLCELVFGDDWCLVYCRECDAKATNILQLK